MIKKLLYSILLVVIIAADAKSQDLIITPSDTLTLDTSTSCQSLSIMTYILKNNTHTNLQMNWYVVYSTFPHGWNLQFCDPQQCRSASIIGSHTWSFTLDSEATGLMQFEPTPASGTACGNYQVFTWATNDSANTATFLNYKTCITTPNCPNGIAETETPQISLYPNPVRNELNVFLPQNLPNGQIDIYNIIGSKVFSESVNSTKELDLSSLETGIYVARISDGGRIIATKKFTKAE